MDNTLWEKKKMMDYIEIGCTPAEEDCAQVGKEGYAKQARAECRRFVEGIKKFFGKPPALADVRIKSFTHDFGSYFEVVVVFDEDDEKAANYAYLVEEFVPGTWEELEEKTFEEVWEYKLEN